MTKHDTNLFRKKLEEMIAGLREEETHLRQTVFHTAEEKEVVEQEPFHSLDDLRHATADDEVAITTLETEENLLTECAAALKRMESGKFGTCEACGKAIAHKRLEAMPYARKCMHCAKAG